MIPLWLITGVGGAAIAGAAAWQVQSARHDAYLYKQEVNARAEARLRRQNAETAATGFEAARVVIQKQIEVVTEEVERVVTKVEYRDRICLDDDGVRAANRALSGSAVDPGQPGAAVRAAP